MSGAALGTTLIEAIFTGSRQTGLSWRKKPISQNIQMHLKNGHWGVKSWLKPAGQRHCRPIVAQRITTALYNMQ